MDIKISNGNLKMGRIPSVSLPAGLTCRANCACQTKCYARKIARLRPTVREAYKTNFDVLKNHPDTYWREVEAAIMLSRYFRYHVSGDIVDDLYFYKMVEISIRNPHCQILCFTKKYEIVNQFIKNGGEIPSSFHVIFSVWRGMNFENPYHLPEAHVRYRDGTTTANMSAHECSGNCANCATIKNGCWSLKNGEQIVFNEH